MSALASAQRAHGSGNPAVTAPLPADGPLLEIEDLQIAYREAARLRTWSTACR
jgi:hypothetical protein